MHYATETSYVKVHTTGCLKKLHTCRYVAKFCSE